VLHLHDAPRLVTAATSFEELDAVVRRVCQAGGHERIQRADVRRIGLHDHVIVTVRVIALAKTISPPALQMEVIIWRNIARLRVGRLHLYHFFVWLLLLLLLPLSDSLDQLGAKLGLFVRMDLSCGQVTHSQILLAVVQLLCLVERVTHELGVAALERHVCPSVARHAPVDRARHANTCVTTRL